MRYLLSAAMIVALAFSGGCGPEDRIAWPKQSMTPTEKNFEALWQASRQVLKEYEFTIARQDRRAATIVTEPMPSAQFFELWRKDASTTYQKVEGNLQNVYRLAAVKIQPRPGHRGQFEPVVKIQLSRHYTGGTFSTTGQAMGHFSSLRATRGAGTSEYRDAQKDVVGMDGELADRIKRDIQKASGEILKRNP